MTHELLRRKVILLAIDWAIILMAGVAFWWWHHRLHGLVNGLPHHHLVDLSPLPVCLGCAWIVAVGYLVMKSLRFYFIGRFKH